MRNLWGSLFHTLRRVWDRHASPLPSDKQHHAQAQGQGGGYYSTIARNLPNTIIMLVDRDMRVLLVEGQFLNKTWYTKETLEGKLIQQVLPAGVGETILSNLAAAWNGEARVRQHVFANYVLILHYVPIRAASGEIDLVMLVAQDTTEMREADTALRESEARYRLIADNSTDMITVLLASGVITYVSPASEQLLGYKPGELLGHSIFELVHPDDLEPRDWLPPQQLLDPRPFITTYRVRCKRRNVSVDGDDLQNRAQ